MPTERLSMRRIRDLLRLKHENGLSSRVIAASLGLSKGAVGDYLRRAQAAGIGWPIDAALTDMGLERLLLPAAPDVMAEDRPEPDWPTVDRELRRSEPRRVSRRLQVLRGRSHDETNPTLFPRSPRTCCADGLRPPRRAWPGKPATPQDEVQVWVHPKQTDVARGSDVELRRCLAAPASALRLPRSTSGRAALHARSLLMRRRPVVSPESLKSVDRDASGILRPRMVGV